MNSTRRNIFYGDSHTQGYEIDHDKILGRDTFREKQDLIHQFGLHQAIMMWNHKMGRATNMTPYDFAHRRVVGSYPLQFDNDAIIIANGAMSMDYLHLQLVNDYNDGRIKGYHDRLFIGMCRPTRTYSLHPDGSFNYSHQDMDGTAEYMTDIRYAVTWALACQSIMDFCKLRHIPFHFVQHFPLNSNPRGAEIHSHPDLLNSPKYMGVYVDTIMNMQPHIIPKSLHEFGEERNYHGFYHTTAMGHNVFATYLKNYLTNP